MLIFLLLQALGLGEIFQVSVFYSMLRAFGRCEEANLPGAQEPTEARYDELNYSEASDHPRVVSRCFLAPAFGSVLQHLLLNAEAGVSSGKDGILFYSIA